MRGGAKDVGSIFNGLTQGEAVIGEVNSSPQLTPPRKRDLGLGGIRVSPTIASYSRESE